MTDGKRDKYAAVDASLGYLYQVRSALLWTLKRLKTKPDFLVGIETLDDVAFESVGGDPRELLQTKAPSERQGLVGGCQHRSLEDA